VPAIRSVVEVSETLEVQEPRAETRSEWADRLKKVAYVCTCGCGTTLRIRPEHRSPSVGIPRFVRGHQQNPLAVLYSAVRSKGLLLMGEVCRRLGISPSTYWRLESGGAFPKAERWGRQPRPDMRVFRPERLDELGRLLRKHRE
jgi:hypothetical protein